MILFPSKIHFNLITAVAVVLPVLFSVLLPATAFADVTCYISADCGSGGNSSRASGNPSTGGEIRINPAAVPTEKGFGIEALVFKDTPDFAIVKGLGRVGAAISPSNSEETFFGPPGIEDTSNLLIRKENKEKYPNQKVTLATAFSLYEKKGSAFRRMSLKLGVLAKYNKISNDITPGGGLTGTIGPLSFGYSMYDDETVLESSNDGYTVNDPIKYQVHTYNVGLYLTSLILDYSVLTQDKPYESTVTLYTASLMVGKAILTASARSEDSPRPTYNYDTQALETQKVKQDYFGGVQYNLSDHFMVGVLYNYYLLHEVSGTITFFF